MRIDFIASSTNITIGSYRIWVHDLCNTLNRLDGVDSCINPQNSNNADVIICSKSDISKVDKIKSKYPDKKVGVINPGGDSCSDFIIVGSPEEYCSFSNKKYVFMYPLIEDMYANVEPKKHKEGKMVIGFHGSYSHLPKFEFGLKDALEELEKEVDFKLLIVSSCEDPTWKVGKPSLRDIEIVKWDFSTITDHLMRMDIGLVPNITNLKGQMPMFLDSDLGLYNSDYFLRYKNKSNAGRAFVFMQLGIPVIADLTPSNLHLLGGLDCGYLAMDKDGWLNALRELQNSQKRQEIANNALLKFRAEYDSTIWAKKLINNFEVMLSD